MIGPERRIVTENVKPSVNCVLMKNTVPIFPNLMKYSLILQNVRENIIFNALPLAWFTGEVSNFGLP